MSYVWKLKNGINKAKEGESILNPPLSKFCVKEEQKAKTKRYLCGKIEGNKEIGGLFWV